MQTPKVIKLFVTLIVTLSLLSGVCDKIFPSVFTAPLFIYNLTLTSSGIEHFYLWQLITHAFVYPAFQGIHAGFLIGLAFSMLIIWRIGSSICFHKGTKHFLNLFLGSSIVSGIAAYFTLATNATPAIFADASCAIFALLVASVILYPEMELMLFLTLPVRGKWLIVGILTSILLIDLSNGLYVHFFANMSAFLFGYLYAILVWRLRSPFQSMQPLESMLLKIPFFNKEIKKDYDSIDGYASGAKIYDFKTGKIILDDEAFVEACLAKIAREGRKSLSVMHRFRLWRIARRNKKKFADRQKKKNYESFRGS